MGVPTVVAGGEFVSADQTCSKPHSRKTTTVEIAAQSDRELDMLVCRIMECLWGSRYRYLGSNILEGGCSHHAVNI